MPIDAVYIYIFRSGNGQTAEERLYQAAHAYLKSDETDLDPANSKGTVPLCHVNICPDTTDGTEDSQNSSFSEASWKVSRTEKGKPYFPMHPDVHFSITHSGDYWLCVFASQPVGVDLQKHTKKDGESDKSAAARFSRMANRFFHPDEAAYIQSAFESQSLEAYKRFFRIWAAKESYVKYTGLGIDKNFNAFSVVPKSLRTSNSSELPDFPKLSKFSEISKDRNSLKEELSFYIPDQNVWKAAGTWFCEVELINGYSLCVCTEKSNSCCTAFISF